MEVQPQQSQVSPSEIPQAAVAPLTEQISSSQPLPIVRVQKKKTLLIVISALLVGLIVGGGVGYAFGHSSAKSKQALSSGSPGNASPAQIAGSGSTSSSSSLTVQNRNAKRETDIQSLHTQIEAYFAENNHYPSLTDLNSPTWRAANIKSTDPSILVDPLSSCNPATTACLVASPVAKAYAYNASNSSGNSCESNDTQCSQYTLTATFEGTVDNMATYSVHNLN